MKIKENSFLDYLMHHGIEGMKWGIRNDDISKREIHKPDKTVVPDSEVTDMHKYGEN